MLSLPLTSLISFVSHRSCFLCAAKQNFVRDSCWETAIRPLACEG